MPTKKRQTEIIMYIIHESTLKKTKVQAKTLKATRQKINYIL